jgi:hypothetical protein
MASWRKGRASPKAPAPASRARRRVGRPPLPQLFPGVVEEARAFTYFQGLAAILAAFSMRRPARLGEMPGPLRRTAVRLPRRPALYPAAGGGLVPADPRREGRHAEPLPRKRLDLPALERRQALKRPAFCATTCIDP